MSSNESEKKILNDVCAVAGLFIIAPAGYILIIYSNYRLYISNENIFDWPKTSILGWILMAISPPLLHWLSYKYCKEKFGWFKKK